jgi:hypothetical protein
LSELDSPPVILVHGVPHSLESRCSNTICRIVAESRAYDLGDIRVECDGKGFESNSCKQVNYGEDVKLQVSIFDLEAKAALSTCTAASLNNPVWNLESFLWRVSETVFNPYESYPRFIMSMDNLDTFFECTGNKHKRWNKTESVPCSFLDPIRFGSEVEHPPTSIKFNDETAELTVEQTWTCTDGPNGPYDLPPCVPPCNFESII